MLSTNKPCISLHKVISAEMLLALRLSPYDMWNEINMLPTAKLAVYSLDCSALTKNSSALSLSPSSAEPGFPTDSWGPQFIFPHKGREKPVVQQANCQQELLQDYCIRSTPIGAPSPGPWPLPTLTSVSLPLQSCGLRVFVWTCSKWWVCEEPWQWRMVCGLPDSHNYRVEPRLRGPAWFSGKSKGRWSRRRNTRGKNETYSPDPVPFGVCVHPVCDAAILRSYWVDFEEVLHFSDSCRVESLPTGPRSSGRDNPVWKL